MKEKGFILHITLITLMVISGIFYLLSLVLQNSLEIANLHSKSLIKSNDLSNIYSTTLYEFSLIDKYILQGKIASKEEYIWDYNEELKLWSTPSTRASKSLGGFYISKITPAPESLNFSGVYPIKFIFTKEILLLDSNSSPFLKILLSTPETSLSCNFVKEDASLQCDCSNIRVPNFYSVGEVIQIEQRDH